MSTIARVQTTPAPPRRDRVVQTGALATTAAFAGGALLIQLVTVPQWRSMDAVAFGTQFATSGPATGAVLFPIEVASVLLLGRAAYSTIKARHPARLPWTLATAAMVGTVLLLPLYFAGANLAMLDPTFPPQSISAELTTWYRWNWIRTGLALAGTVLTCAALVANGRHTITTTT
jgi:hypothetical protein